MPIVAFVALAQRATMAAHDSRSSRSAAIAVSSLCHRATQSSASLSLMPHPASELPCLGRCYRRTAAVSHTSKRAIGFAPHNKKCDLSR
jgi:hypothetical protein